MDGTVKSKMTYHDNLDASISSSVDSSAHPLMEMIDNKKKSSIMSSDSSVHSEKYNEDYGINYYRQLLLTGKLPVSDVEEKFIASRSQVFIKLSGNTLLNPRSNAMFYWQLFNLIFTTICCMLIPVEVAFSGADLGLWMKIIGSIFELFFIIDIAVNFHMPLQFTKNGSYNGNVHEIRREYLRFWLWIDAMSAMPVDLIDLILGRDTMRVLPALFSSLRLVRMLRISKLIRLLRADAIVAMLQDYFSVDQDQTQLLKLLFCVLVTIHLMACGLLIIAELEEADVSWVLQNDLESESHLILYSTSIYWAAMTATTIGYGDILLVTPWERCYSVCCMIIGASIYAFVTSRLVGMIIYSNDGNDANAGSTSHIHDMMSRTSFPHVYRAVINDYLSNYAKYLHVNTVNSSLKVLSPALRGIAAEHLHGEWLSKIPYLRCKCRADLITNRRIAYAIGASLTLELYMPGETIIRRGDRIVSLYVLESGKLYRIHAKRCAPIVSYSTFGEECILSEPRRANYRIDNSGTCYSLVYIIPRESIFNIVQVYPELHDEFRRHLTRLAFRCNVVNTLNGLAKKKNEKHSGVDVAKENCSL